MRIQAVAGNAVDVAHAGTQRQAIQRAAFYIIAQPGAGLIARRVNCTLALLFRAAFLIANVGVGIGGLQAEAIR